MVAPRTRALSFAVALFLTSSCVDGPVDASDLVDAGDILDAGAIADAGNAEDAGSPVDAGAIEDAGSTIDAGSALDAGNAPVDAGASNDAGDTDAGSLLDAGAGDAGSSADAGAPSDAGPADGGGVDDAGAAVDAGEGTDAGAFADAGSAVDYWDGVDIGVDGQPFVLAIHARLASTHIQLDYDALFDAYLVTDVGRGCGDLIFDVYSSYCWDPADRCGNYSGEGQCFNREHSWPKSWWGGAEDIAPYSDLFHVIPADGYVNNRRSNLPFGHVASATYTSTNGSKAGPCVELDALGDCFEPRADLKGDFARIGLYMAMRYEAEFACCARPGVNGADLNPWYEDLFRAWHVADPVDDDERARNDAVFALQGNRNPFVDHPEWVARIADY